MAYYNEHQDTLQALAVDSGSGPIEPAPDTVVTAEYQPLAGLLFIYVNFESAQTNPTVKDFVQFYLENAATTVDKV